MMEVQKLCDMSLGTSAICMSAAWVCNFLCKLPFLCSMLFVICVFVGVYICSTYTFVYSDGAFVHFLL